VIHSGGANEDDHTTWFETKIPANETLVGLRIVGDINGLGVVTMPN